MAVVTPSIVIIARDRKTGHFGKISRVLHRIHANYTRSYDMTTLAREAGMSVFTFHTHFKAVTVRSQRMLDRVVNPDQ